MRRVFGMPGLLLGLVLAIGALPVGAQGPGPAPGQVHAILFYSPTCPHCHTVINEDLPPLLEQYPQQLQIVGVDVSQPQGQELYQAAIETFQIPDTRRGVPTLVIGDRVLVGSGEIPQQLPGLVETYIEQGGVDWPAIPGLEGMVDAMDATPTTTAPVDKPTATATDEDEAAIGPAPPTTPTPTATPAPTTTPKAGLVLPTENAPPDWRTNFSRDPVGNTLAVVVLVGMVLVVGGVIVALRGEPKAPPPGWHHWTMPALALLGLVVAGYLSYVETQNVTAVCGPFGDCNTVQQSPYAYLFGVIPIGILGMGGYIAILVAWGIYHFDQGRLGDMAALALLGMTLGGTLFSIYLTFLEPFVIGATCAWCLKSALIMTVLLWLSVGPGKCALLHLHHGRTLVKSEERG